MINIIHKQCFSKCLEAKWDSIDGFIKPPYQVKLKHLVEFKVAAKVMNEIRHQLMQDLQKQK